LGGSWGSGNNKRVTKRRLSDQFRRNLQSLGASLGAHARSLENHFEAQQEFLAIRYQDLEERERLLLPAVEESEGALEVALRPLIKGDFWLLTVPQLRKLCSRAKLTGCSRLKKKQLIALLEESGVSAPPLEVGSLKRAQLEAIAYAVLECISME
jgi:hypothetical protein